MGKAYTPEEKTALVAAACAARSPAIYPALMLALNAGMRDAEIRRVQWGRKRSPEKAAARDEKCAVPARVTPLWA